MLSIALTHLLETLERDQRLHLTAPSDEPQEGWHATHAVSGLGVATPFAAAQLPHAVVGVLTGPAADIDLLHGSGIAG